MEITMTVRKQTTAFISRRVVNTPRLQIFQELLIWNAAWREYRHLQMLDAAALHEMGMTDAAHASVTVAQIAARMRR
jgi:hypothetical protein